MISLKSKNYKEMDYHQSQHSLTYPLSSTWDVNTYSPNTKTKNESLFKRLAFLSQRPSWVLFTAQCSSVKKATLSQFGVDCRKVIQVKSSQRYSEIEIVTNVIMAGNASAIVATDRIDLFNQKRLLLLAIQHNCELFFISETKETTATHFH